MYQPVGIASASHECMPDGLASWLELEVWIDERDGVC